MKIGRLQINILPKKRTPFQQYVDNTEELVQKHDVEMRLLSIRMKTCVDSVGFMEKDNFQLRKDIQQYLSRTAQIEASIAAITKVLDNLTRK